MKNDPILCSSAFRGELYPLERRLSSKRKEGEIVFGELWEKQVAFLPVGVGPEVAEKTVSALLPRIKPRLLILAGLAGGLSPDLPVGELVLVDGGFSLSAEGNLNPVFTVQGSLIKLAEKALVDRNIPFTVGSSITLDTLLLSSEEKLSFFRRFPQLSIVDMEDTAVAKAAMSFNIPFLIIRIVSDSAKEDLKPVLSLYHSKKGLSRALIFLNPFSLFYLFSIWLRGIRLSSPLSQAVSAIISAL
ncbi:MAG: hypothetical protein J7L64_05805 [Acidobacteria bacterium]|nr:hypothetical protein [Acidobacteriota bacterium]